MACCLVKAPAARPSAATLLRHPFITRVDGVPPAWKAFIYNKVGVLSWYLGFTMNVNCIKFDLLDVLLLFVFCVLY